MTTYCAALFEMSGRSGGKTARIPTLTPAFVIRPSPRPLANTMMPKVSMQAATQLGGVLEQQARSLARVCEALAAADVAIHAMTTSDTVDHSVVRTVVSDPTRALMLLGEAGVWRSRTMS